MQLIEKSDDRNAQSAERETCGKHQFEWLLPREKTAHMIAKAQVDRLEHVSPAVVAILLEAVERLEHEAAHGHWGDLECDQQDRYPAVTSPAASLPVIPMPGPQPETGPVFLYRFFDHCGCLLYVGITNDFEVRKAAHAKDSPWHKLAADWTVAEMPSRADAAVAEVVAINAESPAFNRAGRSARDSQEAITAYLIDHAAAVT